MCHCRATRELKRICPGCKISGGVSNIAFGFRGNDAVRRGFHSAFLHYACKVSMHRPITAARLLHLFTLTTHALCWNSTESAS